MSPWSFRKESGQAVPPQLPGTVPSPASPAPGHLPASDSAAPTPAGSAEPLGPLVRQLVREVGKVLKDDLASELARHSAGASAERLDEHVRDQLAGLAGRFDQQFDALRGKLDRLCEGVERLAQAPTGPTASAGAPIEAAMVDEKLRPLAEQLAAIDAKLPSFGTPRGDEIATELTKAIAPLKEELSGLRRRSDAQDAQQESIASKLSQLYGRFENGLAELVGYLRPAPEPPPSSSPADEAEWQRAILGPQLAAQSALGAERRRLLADVLDGNGGAMALAGQLLVFQSSPPEKMAQQLKEIGEAFYRWQPKRRAERHPMEDALVQWLRKCCEDAGIGNVIELVQPGERFDSSRHATDGRGVEITEVRGWIVLRDNGKVYTKATVAVR